MSDSIHHSITSTRDYIQRIIQHEVDTPPIASKTAKVYLRHINAFSYASFIRDHDSLDAIKTDELQAWINHYAAGASKYKQTSAALKFLGRYTGQDFLSAYEIHPPKLTRSVNLSQSSSKFEPRFISPDQLSSLRKAQLSFFGSMYPERNRAIALLTLDTLADMEDIRSLRNMDVTDQSVIFTNRPLDQRDMGAPSWTVQILHDYRRWRTNKYGKDRDGAPFFRSNRGGKDGEALTPSGIYRIFQKIVLGLGYANQQSGEGHNIFRISCARKMYLEGCDIDRLSTLFGIREGKGALAESLHITDDMRHARQKMLERNQLFAQGKNCDLPSHSLRVNEE